LIVSPTEEAGSAGGQPASNKADTYTVKNERSVRLLILFITGKLYGFKNSLPIQYSAYYSFLVCYAR
jgi:hypothetical protein